MAKSLYTSSGVVQDPGVNGWYGTRAAPTEGAIELKEKFWQGNRCQNHSNLLQ